MPELKEEIRHGPDLPQREFKMRTVGKYDDDCRLLIWDNVEKRPFAELIVKGLDRGDVMTQLGETLRKNAPTLKDELHIIPRGGHMDFAVPGSGTLRITNAEAFAYYVTKGVPINA